MRGLGLYFCLTLLLAFFLQENNAGQLDRKGVYIVYMGASRSADGSPRNDHAQLLSSLMKRKRNPVIHNYNNGFSGFAAHLSEEEAKSIAQRPGVVSVFPNSVFQLHTTHSWKFLEYQASVKIDSTPAYPSGSSSAGADIVIGILDTGIWPESKSFDDKDMGPIPPTWKGKCMEGRNFTSSNCNKKVIGARYYDDSDPAGSMMGTPRDETGHGTHVAATAAGSPVFGASYYGQAEGTAVGGSPTSRIAMYRVCSPGCSSAAILKGFDDAIADGVNVLSLSLGSPQAAEPDFITDPIAIGAFHAVENDIIVVCSAGNSGPFPSSIVNNAPWILTVAASTIDRDFEADILLGGNKTIKGGGINFSELDRSPVYPLIDGNSAKSNSSQQDASDARNCATALDDSKVKGKIVLCENKDHELGAADKFDMLKSQGAIGMILVDDNQRLAPSTYKTSPIVVVTEDDAAYMFSYINSSSNPMATILPTKTVLNYKPAPVVIYFSSRGPVLGIKNLIKPDVAAPGVAILAAWPSNDEDEALPGKDPPLYVVLSGTSMSCPHVSGLAAAVMSQNPTWSHSAVRSAIMTTATQTDNSHAPIKANTVKGSIATPYDIGSGQISTSGSLQPGLVYETEVIDYLLFLCNFGYDTAKIKNISHTAPSDFSCPSDSNPDSISNMNYPSIAVSNLKQNEIKTVNRTVTNVGEQDSTYTAIVEAPANVQVEVVPNELQFSKTINKLSFQVTFKLTATSRDVFGSITWSSTKYKVRSPFVVVTRA